MKQIEASCIKCYHKNTHLGLMDGIMIKCTVHNLVIPNEFVCDDFAIGLSPSGASGGSGAYMKDFKGKPYKPNKRVYING